MRKPPTTGTMRVAIYTRQSVASDLEFGSIDAQREAVEAYVQSQRGQGWVALPDRFDDHGYSGSNTDRPAFQRLLADIEAGKIDVLAAYRTDRVSRSLADFTALMRDLEKRGIGFCSVTQSFDSTTPMGKFVMNMLASFSEFERATIAERTADKIRATRRRGQWTGGRVPLGYDLIDGKLVVNVAEAETVRQIFACYLAHGGLVTTVEELHRRALKNKSWTNKAGGTTRGAAFNKESLRTLLINPLYIGMMRCGDELADGRHEAIIDAATFETVARALCERRKPYRATAGKWGALLTGILRCARCGAAMTHQVSVKGGKAFKYYCCTTIQKQGAAACRGSRAPAEALEDVVVSRVKAIGVDPTVLTATMAAAQQARRAQEPELIAEARRVAGERTTLDGQRRNLLDALAQGGVASNTIASRIGELDEQIGLLQRRHDEVIVQLAALATGTVDEAAIGDALREFTAAWDALIPRERARVLRLLLEEVAFDGPGGRVEMRFRETGIASLSRDVIARRPA
jgi:site-specific DNA recombinase